MKHVLSAFVICMIALSGDAFAANTGRLGVQKNVMSSARMPSMPVKTIGMSVKVSEPAPVTPSDTVEPEPSEPDTPVIDTRDKEREACIRNNIGVGNTFVWASRYSDINDYSTMVEDVEHPENNVCFVRVELKSSDPRIDLSDIGGKYFEFGDNIVCGSWVDESIIEKRILDAKKKGRTWATIGGSVGGAALGVGAMELFGNKLIGGAVMGQKAKAGDEQTKSMLALMKTEDVEEYNAIIADLEAFKAACANATGEHPECKEIPYDYLLSE